MTFKHCKGPNMLPISKRAQKLAPSETLAMAAKARELKAKGIDVVSFATGEPDFDTPSFVKASAKKALDDGLTKYTPSAGIPELRKAIKSKFKSDNGLDYAEDEICVTCGAKQAIYNALQVLLGDGDEAIVVAPYWVSYPEQVRLAGAAPVIVPTTAKSFFKLTPASLEAAITPRTRAIILNTPSNPTGSAYTRGELAALGEILARHGVAIISDEIYEKLVYGEFRHVSIAAACPAARDLTITVNGVSKAYAMTGWRMGYAAGPREVISKMTTLLGQQITGIPGFVQRACVDALTGPQEEIERMRKEFAARRDLMLELLLSIPEIRCHVPEGAFYLLPNIEAYLGRKWNGRAIADATELAGYLLDEAHIATVSGDPFGIPGYIRFSYATSRENIEEGARRLKDALLKLS